MSTEKGIKGLIWFEEKNREIDGLAKKADSIDEKKAPAKKLKAMNSLVSLAARVQKEAVKRSEAFPEEPSIKIPFYES